MFHLNTIDQLEVCLPYSRILTGIIPTLAVFQNLRWNSNKTFSTQTYSPLCLQLFLRQPVHSIEFVEHLPWGDAAMGEIKGKGVWSWSQNPLIIDPLMLPISRDFLCFVTDLNNQLIQLRLFSCERKSSKKKLILRSPFFPLKNQIK